MDTLQNKQLAPHQFELLKQEFMEAWSHYRHLEADRTSYLTLFFILIAGSIGLLTAFYLSESVKTSSGFLYGAFLFVWFLDLVTLFIYAQVKQTGYLLFHYQKVWIHIREIIYKDEYTVLDKFLNVYENLPAIKNSRLFSVQWTAEFIIIIPLLVFSVLLFLLTYAIIRLQNVFYLKLLEIAVLLIFLGFIFILKYLIFNKIRHSKEERENH